MKINKLLVLAKREAKRREHAEIEKVFQQMTTDQLEEIAYGDPSENRLREILASVDGLHLLESG
ncbi:MAG: hypothetical protein IJ381_07205 [Clostridia bacterium]|nr:hypothetical protein [Clostridia bacterium]